MTKTLIYDKLYLVESLIDLSDLIEQVKEKQKVDEVSYHTATGRRPLFSSSFPQVVLLEIDREYASPTILRVYHVPPSEIV
ncbi:hypothetical protein AVT69_gp024 [Pseudomonas phage PhiPA3]|uniref:Uncharacterized protein 024 n=1 Tax=Pseudomonas phage PhiPA3 TaxID=998086 RepID=F8SJQ5_BPPA3|nr:hypothetical protein AVT69_gp024 [Pseudomonas phage PhiPA3]AEH03450.1 hypothetical protein [Pseudomonas phage PhiPA3]